MKIFADLNETLITARYGNPDLAVARDLNKEFPGIFRYVIDQLSDVASWEDHVLRSFNALGIFGVPRKQYISAAKIAVEKVEVPEPVIKSFEKVSDMLIGLYAFTGNSQEISKLILEKKLRPLLPNHVELRSFGTELYLDEQGCFSGKIGDLYGSNQRVEMLRELKRGDIAVSIADNHSNVNQGMVREGDYGILLSNAWERTDRQGNIFYVRPKHLYVAIDQIANKSLPKNIINCVIYERGIDARLG